MNATRGLLGYYCGNRLFEWVMALILFSCGVHLLIWPHAVAASGFRLILQLVGPASLALFYLAVGLFRLAALVANGAWPDGGPVIRALGALGGAVVWGQMSYALAALVPVAGTPPSPGIEVYALLALGELISCYRALQSYGQH